MHMMISNYKTINFNPCVYWQSVFMSKFFLCLLLVVCCRRQFVLIIDLGFVVNARKEYRES